jgi:NAD(P)-dependent dehydrogenase (short-subunit alcohol dehydrogenase family)
LHLVDTSETDQRVVAAIDGQVAIVTGGAAGIGAATCRRLALAGATVVVADIETDGAEAVAASTRGPRTSVARGVDVADPGAVTELVRGVVADFGAIHLLVNNAGIAPVDPLETASYEIWRRTFAVNVEGPFAAIRAATTAMLDQEPFAGTGCRGKVVTVSSAAAEHGRPLMPAYGASKAALDHLSRSTAVAFGDRAIATTILYPGNVDGAMWPGLAERLAPLEGRSVQAVLDERAASSPYGRFQQPDEVARMVVYIAGFAGMGLNGGVLWSEPHVRHA